MLTEAQGEAVITALVRKSLAEAETRRGLAGPRGEDAIEAARRDPSRRGRRLTAPMSEFIAMANDKEEAKLLEAERQAEAEASRRSTGWTTPASS